MDESKAALFRGGIYGGPPLPTDRFKGTSVVPLGLLEVS